MSKASELGEVMIRKSRVFEADFFGGGVFTCKNKAYDIVWELLTKYHQVEIFLNPETKDLYNWSVQRSFRNAL